jgi:ABC-2 type transport system ATP-binding protein
MQQGDGHLTNSSVAPSLAVEGVRKSYGDHVALAGVDLTLAPGTILGLLGPNGAGKTTLVSIVAGLRRPDAGSVHVCGIDALREPQRARTVMGLAPQETGVYITLSVRDNLRYFAGLGGLRGKQQRERIDEIASTLLLDELMSRQCQTLSGGERRRLHAAIALLHEPRLVLLDEPTTGADVTTRTHLLDLVRSLAEQGAAVVYSTHYLHEIEELGAEVVFIDRGHVIASGTLPDLVTRYGASALELSFERAVPERLALLPGAVVAGTSVTIPADDPAATAARVLPTLGEAAGLRNVELVRPNLESVFLAVTGRRYDAMAEVAA